MELFPNVFLGILQKFFVKLFKIMILTIMIKLLLEVLNILIRIITFTAKTWQTITEISVICIIRINVSQLHIYFCDSSTQSFRSAIVNKSCFLNLDYFLWAGPAMFAYWLRQRLHSYNRGMRVPVSCSHIQPDKHGSHFCISLFIECTQ